MTYYTGFISRILYQHDDTQLYQNYLGTLEGKYFININTMLPNWNFDGNIWSWGL